MNTNLTYPDKKMSSPDHTLPPHSDIKMSFLDKKSIFKCPYITMLYWHINMPDRDIIMPHLSIVGVLG